MQYQTRVRDEHKNMLASQIDENKRYKMAIESAERQEDAALAQKAGLFHQQYEQ